MIAVCFYMINRKYKEVLERKVNKNKINMLKCIYAYTKLYPICHDNARCESMWARFKEELLMDATIPLR